MTSRILLRIFSAVGLIFALGFHLSAAHAEDAPCDTYQVNGGDEYFLMNLNTPLKFGNTVYNGNVYVTPKATMTFGIGDFTFWDYPNNPSISIASYDYHAFANNFMWGGNNNLYVKYGSTSSSICVEWRVLPWGQSSGTPVLIRMRANVDPVTYEWIPTYEVSSNAPATARYGVRYTKNEPVQSITVLTISPSQTPTPTPTPTITETPTPTPTPTPTETITPTPEPTPSETSSPTPTPTIEPTPEPTPEPSQDNSNNEPISVVVTPEPSPTPTPTITTTPEPEITEQIIEPETSATPEPEQTNETIITPIDDNNEPPVDENVGLLESTEIVFAVFTNAVSQTFEFAGEVAGEVFAIADEAVGAFLNIGDDMSPEVREEAQSVVVSTIIVTQIASAVSLSMQPSSGTKGVKVK